MGIFGKSEKIEDSSLGVYKDILELLPNENNPTPMVKLNKVNSFRNIQMYAKLEWYNPFGSVKDRIAFSLIKDAEERGLLSGKKIIEPTSGNTGIGLVSIANAKGYKIRNTVSSDIPEEKKAILRFLGAEVVEVADSLCPDPKSKSGAIGLAKSTVENFPQNFYMPNQYENEANILAHYKTTGPEIWKQTKKKITHFIAGLGTCGTIGGVAKFLKEKNPEIKIIGVCPEEGHNIPGVRSLKQLEVTKLYKPELYDHVIEVTNREAYDMCLRLNVEESIIAGPSSGMAVAGAMKSLKSEEGIAVLIFPDNIFKYVSFLEKNLHVENQKEQTLVKPDEQQATSSISPKELKEKLDKKEDLILVDVREPWENKICSIERSKLIPLGELGEKTEELDKSKEIVLYCHHGGRSFMALNKLKKLGFKKLKNLDGGIDAWAEDVEPKMERY